MGIVYHKIGTDFDLVLSPGFPGTHPGENSFIVPNRQRQDVTFYLKPTGGFCEGVVSGHY